MRSTSPFAAAIAVILLSMPLQKATATSFSWSFQDIGTSTGASSVTLSMRTGATWPVAFSGYSAQVTASTLTPVGWMSSSLGAWDGSFIRSAAGQDGRIAAAWQSSGAIRFAQSGPGGWYQTSFAAATGSRSAPDVAYLSGNRPVLAYSDSGTLKVAAYDGVGWTTATVRAGASDVKGDNVSIAVDSQDRIYIAYMMSGSAYLAMKEPYASDWTQWKGTGTSPQPVIPFSVTNVSLACGPHDQIGMAASGIQTGSGVSYAWFAPQSGTWQVDQVYAGYLSNASALVDLAFNGNGDPALAYGVTGSGSNLHYRTKVGYGWADALVPDQSASQSNVALAFDSDNLPVLSYMSYSSGRLRLAYDPVITPEPASLVILAVGACAIVRRRRGA